MFLAMGPRSLPLFTVEAVVTLGIPSFAWRELVLSLPVLADLLRQSLPLILQPLLSGAGNSSSLTTYCTIYPLVYGRLCRKIKISRFTPKNWLSLDLEQRQQQQQQQQPPLTPLAPSHVGGWS